MDALSATTQASKSHLLTRMMAPLLPAALLPLFMFGYVALRSHYESLRTGSVRQHDTLATLFERQLEDEIDLSRQQLVQTTALAAFMTVDRARMREEIALWRKFNSNVVRATFVDSSDVIVISEPVELGREGRPYTDLDLTKENLQGFRPGPFFEEADTPHFLMSQRVTSANGEIVGRLVVHISFAQWLATTRALLVPQPNMLVAIVPNNAEGANVQVSEQPRPTWINRITQLRLAGPAEDEPTVDGERNYTARRRIEVPQMVLIVAQPLSDIYAAPRRVLVGYVISIFAVTSALGTLLFLMARSITARVNALSKSADQYSEGKLEVRAAVTGNDELTALAEKFNSMGENLQGTNLRLRVMYKSIMELFSCSDLDDLLRRSVELACTQCAGEVAWFLPTKAGRQATYKGSELFVGLHGWAWRTHRLIEISEREATGLWESVPGERIFRFAIRAPGEGGAAGQEIGILRVAYRKNPSEFNDSLLNALVSLVETAVSKQENLRVGVAASTELTMAEAIHRNVMTNNLVLSEASRVAWHYRPASRLGGDWFYIIDDTKRGKIYAIIGDVPGYGLPQGLITMAVKGALDVIDVMIKRDDTTYVTTPADIMHVLETVVRRAAGPEALSMTCLVSEIDVGSRTLKTCNAGHTFPILLRQEGGVNVARHLHKSQQPMLGQVETKGRPHTFVEATYELRPGDLMVIYTDGLTDAKNFKPGIFGRFMLRGLRKDREYRRPEELRDEILAMFNYYTQGARIEDDVCFVVVQIPPLGYGTSRDGRRTA